MNDRTAANLVRAFALNAEVEGMKVFNAERLANGMSPGYAQHQFDQKAFELEELAREIMRNAP